MRIESEKTGARGNEVMNLLRGSYRRYCGGEWFRSSPPLMLGTDEGFMVWKTTIRSTTIMDTHFSHTDPSSQGCSTRLTMELQRLSRENMLVWLGSIRNRGKLRWVITVFMIHWNSNSKHFFNTIQKLPRYSDDDAEHIFAHILNICFPLAYRSVPIFVPWAVIIVLALSWKPPVCVKVPSPADPTENWQSSLQLYSHFSPLFWSSTPSGWAPVSLTSLPIGNIGQQLPAHKLIVHYLLRAKWWRAVVNKCPCRDVNINNLRMAKFFLEELVLKDQQNIRLSISVIIPFISTSTDI